MKGSGIKDGGRFFKALAEVGGLLRAPQRTLPLAGKIISDKVRTTFEQRNLYSYTKSVRDSQQTLDLLMRWMLGAQRPDGGIAAYYSLFTGYSQSYPEVTGYIIPTLYDFARANSSEYEIAAAERATCWLLSLQMPDGAFPGGLHGAEGKPSVFNTGQILQGLIRAYCETDRIEIRRSAVAAGDWLIAMQQSDGSWSGPGAYQDKPHTYYTMVAWALADLAESTGESRFAHAAGKNVDWTLGHSRPNGWIDGINLQGHPNYLHFIAYVLQGALECAIRLRRTDTFELVEKSAWVLLRKFETNKFLSGAYDADFKNARQFTCLTGNAQMACVWFRLYEVSGDLRYFNAALKMNEMLKRLIPLRGGLGIVGGVSGSYPVWGRYQPFRYISWGGKFFADALLLELRLKESGVRKAESSSISKALPCAS